MPPAAPPTGHTSRRIVIGRNSHIWSVLSQQPAIIAAGFDAIGHRDVPTFAWRPDDQIWILSYSREAEGNRALLEHLHSVGVSDVNYVTSASTNVAAVTSCYQYPRIKRLAHEQAIALCQANVLSIGVFYTDPTELPAGTTAATAAATMADFLCRPVWQNSTPITPLFQPVTRPFRGSAEAFCYRSYGILLKACGPFPCLLRPFDVLLRALGMRWYGYLYLSNRLWFSTTSSSAQV